MSTGIPMLRVRAETILLRVRVILFPVNVYERDGNNFIIWREPSNDINNNNNNERDEDNDMLFSLSFQNPAGRDDIWQNIIQIQARARIAAINIQAYVRTLIQRHRYVHVRNSTIIIQAYVRRLNLAMRNSSATINNHPIKCTYDHPTSTIPGRSTSSFDAMKTRAILGDCNSPSPEKNQRQEVQQQRYRSITMEPCAQPSSPPLPPQMLVMDDSSFADVTNGDDGTVPVEDGEIVEDYAAAEAEVERRKNHDGDGVGAAMSQQHQNVAETRTSKRGSRGKKSRNLHTEKRNRVGRNGGDGGGHGNNVRRRIS